MSSFNSYFASKDYDAFVIDNALKGNSLLFTLLYVYQKLNWKSNLVSVS